MKNGKRVEAGLIGHPLGHTLSPAIFKFLAQGFPQMQLDYSPYDVGPENLQSVIETLRHRKNFKGLNVTIPFKETLALLADSLSKEAKLVGAVNVVSFRNKKLSAYNTDVVGIHETLSEFKIAVKNKTVLILGAGGSAKAVGYVMGRLGAFKVFIYNRTGEKAKALASHLAEIFPKTQFHAIDNLLFSRAENPALVVNATPMGMQGYEDFKTDQIVDHLKVLFSGLKSKAWAFDLVYRPAMTPFLMEAEKYDVRTVGGIHMLIYQALATWEIWFGKLKLKPKLKKQLEKMLLFHLNPRAFSNIVLTGFMATGKTSTGKALADLVGWTFRDTDDLIKEKTGLSAAELFETRGEEYFRNLESDVVAEVLKAEKQVVSLGGGALVRKRNLDLVKETGLIVQLTATPQTILRRLIKAPVVRPLIMSHPPAKRLSVIQNLLKQRKSVYDLAQISVKTDALPVSKVATKVFEKIVREEFG